MKYTRCTKKELLELIQCLEHNCNVRQERNDRQFGMLIEMQKKLYIAVKALEEITTDELIIRRDENLSILTANRALAKIKEIK